MQSTTTDRGRRRVLRGLASGAASVAVTGLARAGDRQPTTLGDSGLAVARKHPELHVLNGRPLNLEPPAHLLDDALTPADRMFVRNNGIAPERVDAGSWRLEIGGESARAPRSFSIEELRQRFETVSYALTIECAGNGRDEFRPRASGNQWTTGAVSCARWTGVRLRDVLESVGITDSARYLAYYGADRHLSGDPRRSPISRGVPIDKALQDESVIAWAMNDEPIPALHGHPLRLVFGGWPGSTSGKWLRRLVIRDRVHDGAKMTGMAYRMPCTPAMAGVMPDENAMCIIESMPVKSLITFPRSGLEVALSEPMVIRGAAWAGDRAVRSVHWSLDYGQRWHAADLAPAPNRFAWQRFTGAVRWPKAGYYEVWVRATDDQGSQQPMVVPGWNPKGYLNNACHRIAVRVLA